MSNRPWDSLTEAILCKQGVRKLHQQLQQTREAVVDRSMPKQKARAVQAHGTSIDADLEQAAQVLLAEHEGFNVTASYFLSLRAVSSP